MLGPEKTTKLRDIISMKTVPSVHRWVHDCLFVPLFLNQWLLKLAVIVLYCLNYRYKTNKDFDSRLSQSVADQYRREGLTSGEYPTLTGIEYLTYCVWLA